MFYQKYYTLIGLLFFCVFQVFAQKNEVTTIVTTQNGEQRIGTVNFKDWRAIPKKIKFTDQNQQKHILIPSEVKQIEFKLEEPQIFAGQMMPVALYDNSPSKFQNAEILPTKIDTFFTRALILGTASLYEYTENLGARHYFLVKDSVWEELIYHTYKTEAGSIQQNQSYKKQLWEKMKDCPSLEKGIIMLEFNPKDVVTLIKDYNDCSEEGFTIHVETPKKNKVRFGVRGGVATSHIVARKSIDTKFDYNLVPQIGLVAEVEFHRSQKRNLIQLELLYTEFISDNTSDDTFNLYQADESGIDVNVIYKYRFSKNDYKSYLQIGSKLSFKTTPANNTRITSILGASPGFVAGVGINKDKWNLDLRYESYSIKNWLDQSTIFHPISISLTGAYLFL